MPSRKPHFFTYIVKVDSGFAPNPLGGFCTLSCCKPAIRKNANVGDWIMGTSPAPQAGRLVYAMRITRGLTFDMYFDDPLYSTKKPGPDNPRGDNIYKVGSNGKLEQIENPSHDEQNIKKDTSVNRVLISNDFYYFGKNAPQIPSRFNKIIHKTQGHKRIKPGSAHYSLAEEFLAWCTSEFHSGIQGTPLDERKQCRLPETSQVETTTM
jgi:hypothetical protein